MANEQDSIVPVVHGCFPGGGNSILSTLAWESHDQPVHVCEHSLLNIANASKFA